MIRTYTHEDVMQAVCAALLFGEDAGLCAIEAAQTLAQGGIAPDEQSVLDHVTLYPGAGNVVHLSPMATQALGLAQAELGVRAIAIARDGGRMQTFDLSLADKEAAHES